MRSELEQRLQDLHRAPAPGQARHQQAHESSVMAAFARRSAAGAPRRSRRARLVLGGMLGAAVAVGACALPAEYPVSLGYGLEISVDPSRWEQLDPDAIARRVREQPGTERVELRVARTVQERLDPDGRPQVDERVSLQLFVMGDALDTERLWSDLREDFPVLAQARIHDVPLAGTVHGTLGGELSHRFLDLTLDRHGVEQAERRIMAELLAEGIAPDRATVDIEQSVDADGRRRIEVRVEAER